MANKLCNEYGLDTIGAGATIAWAMDCFENGLLSEEETGFPLRFGDAVAAMRAAGDDGQARGLRRRAGRGLGPRRGADWARARST